MSKEKKKPRTRNIVGKKKFFCLFGRGRWNRSCDGRKGRLAVIFEGLGKKLVALKKDGSSCSSIGFIISLTWSIGDTNSPVVNFLS